MVVKALMTELWAGPKGKLPENRGEEASTTQRQKVKGSIRYLSQRGYLCTQGHEVSVQPHREGTGENAQPLPPGTQQSPAEAQAEGASWHGPPWPASWAHCRVKESRERTSTSMVNLKGGGGAS